MTYEADRDPVFGPLGKHRNVAVTILLSVVTCGVYYYFWLAYTYREVRARVSPPLTKITPLKAVLFMFIPLFNFYWAIRLVYDLPRAVVALQRADPPSGSPYNGGMACAIGIGGIAIGGTVTVIAWVNMAWLGLQGQMYDGMNPGLTALNLLTVVGMFVWIGMTQSALNGHWAAHRRSPETE